MVAIINSILFHIFLKTTFLVFEICSVIFQICEPYYKAYTFMFINWAATHQILFCYTTIVIYSRNQVWLCSCNLRGST